MNVNTYYLIFYLYPDDNRVGLFLHYIFNLHISDFNLEFSSFNLAFSSFNFEISSFKLFFNEMHLS